MVQRFPAFALDFLYELEIPEEWTGNFETGFLISYTLVSNKLSLYKVNLTCYIPIIYQHICYLMSKKEIKKFSAEFEFISSCVFILISTCFCFLILKIDYNLIHLL